MLKHIVAACLFVSPLYAKSLLPPVAVQAEATTCFTAPGMNAHCADRIAAQIDTARVSVRVQAYSFTSVPIIKALLAAHARGVSVAVILDKSMETGRYSGATPLVRAGVPVWIDTVPTIAHNKIMIIDGSLVITGSFNYTASADTRNAENVVFLTSPLLAQSFNEYWLSRQRVSKRL